MQSKLVFSGVDWLKSQLTSIEYENYEKMDCTFQFYAKFHYIKTMNNASNQINYI